ncbi:hypothetical protein V6N13_017228 [Hibiscus sabdariffa]
MVFSPYRPPYLLFQNISESCSQYQSSDLFIQLLGSVVFPPKDDDDPPRDGVVKSEGCGGRRRCGGRVPEGVSSPSDYCSYFFLPQFSNPNEF